MMSATKSRMQFSDLPAEIAAQVERVLGSPVVDASSQAEGFSPGSADRVVTADGRRGFVKAVHRARNAGSYELHQREIAVMRLIPAEVSTPALLGDVVTEDWAVLILEDIEGRHPGSARDGSDVFAVLDAFATFPRLAGAAREQLPTAVDEFRDEQDSWRRLEQHATPIPEWAERHRARLRAAGERVCEAVEGEYLQHLDGRADNVLMDADGRAWVIDWPWAASGARWLDGLFYLLDASLRGEAVDVEELLSQHPLFDGVADADIDSALAAVTGRFFVKAQLPAPPEMPTLREFQYQEALAGLALLRRRWS